MTTTTTKVTEYPPLLLKPPPKLRSLDLADYPLASTPTPPALKKFCFDLHGVPTHFKELDMFEDDFLQVLYSFCFVACYFFFLIFYHYIASYILG